MLDNPDRIIPRRKRSFSITYFLTILFFIWVFFRELIRGLLPVPLEIELIIVSFVVILIIISWYFSKKSFNDKWQLFSVEHGLKIMFPGKVKFFSDPLIEGRYRSHNIRIDFISEKRGRNSQTFTRLVLFLHKPLNGSIEFKRRSLINPGEDVSDDEAFRKSVAVKTTSLPAARALLKSQRIRTGIIEIRDQVRHLNITITGNTITHIEPGKIRDTIYVLGLMDFLSQLTNQFERP